MSMLFATGEDRGAVISEDGLYRYVLWRTWDPGRGRVNFVMLNPSKADASADDPTIRRCVGFARAWDYGGVIITNLFALRSTDPAALRSARDPIGGRNDAILVAIARQADLVVCAWGAHKSIGGRAAAVLRLLAGEGIALSSLSRTSGGEPGHPLFLKGDLMPTPFAGPEVIP
jgi:hypothetical protein